MQQDKVDMTIQLKPIQTNHEAITEQPESHNNILENAPVLASSEDNNPLETITGQILAENISPKQSYHVDALTFKYLKGAFLLETEKGFVPLRDDDRLITPHCAFEVKTIAKEPIRQPEPQAKNANVPANPMDGCWRLPSDAAGIVPRACISDPLNFLYEQQGQASSCVNPQAGAMGVPMPSLLQQQSMLDDGLTIYNQASFFSEPEFSNPASNPNKKQGNILHDLGINVTSSAIAHHKQSIEKPQKMFLEQSPVDMLDEFLGEDLTYQPIYPVPQELKPSVPLRLNFIGRLKQLKKQFIGE